MSTADTDLLDQEVANLPAELVELDAIEAAQIFR
jgi:hypothetical protein